MSNVEELSDEQLMAILDQRRAAKEVIKIESIRILRDKSVVLQTQISNKQHELAEMQREHSKITMEILALEPVKIAPKKWSAVVGNNEVSLTVSTELDTENTAIDSVSKKVSYDFKKLPFEFDFTQEYQLSATEVVYIESTTKGNKIKHVPYDFGFVKFNKYGECIQMQLPLLAKTSILFADNSMNQSDKWNIVPCKGGIKLILNEDILKSIRVN